MEYEPLTHIIHWSIDPSNIIIAITINSWSCRNSMTAKYEMYQSVYVIYVSAVHPMSECWGGAKTLLDSGIFHHFSIRSEEGDLCDLENILTDLRCREIILKKPTGTIQFVSPKAVGHWFITTSMAEVSFRLWWKESNEQQESGLRWGSQHAGAAKACILWLHMLNREAAVSHGERLLEQNGMACISSWGMTHLQEETLIHFWRDDCHTIVCFLENMRKDADVRCSKCRAPWIWVTIWLFNIAMGNDPFIDGLPIKNGDFPWLC